MLVLSSTRNSDIWPKGQEMERGPLMGGDISLLARVGERGGVYQEGGEARDALAIFGIAGYHTHPSSIIGSSADR